MFARAFKSREKARPRRERAQRNKPRARQCVVCRKTFYTTTGTKTCSTEHWQEHLRAVRRAAVRRYQQSKEGQQARLRYEQSEKRCQTRRNYHQSELYREAKRRYEQSEAEIISESVGGFIPERRAASSGIGTQTVRDDFVAHRIETSRMRTISYGKDRRPVAVCDDVSCWSQNRRAVIVLDVSS